MYNGILPVYKERGLTSHDVVFKLRKILKTKKVGHTGTLDPEVSGVLPICIGSATKVSDYIMEMGKSYEATVTLGISTTTEDQTGDTLEQKAISDSEVSHEAIDEVLKQFEGIITQIPPMYSSVKVNGRKLYEYARNNETVERPERQVNIINIKRISDLHFANDICQFDITVECGKGTYIRTLATDIGKALSLPAHMSKLTRTQSGGFDLNHSYSLSDIAELHEHEALQRKLFPIEYGLKGLPQIMITDKTIKAKILNGQKFYKSEFNAAIQTQVVMVDDESEKVLAIYEPHPDKIDEIKPKKVFN
ncbi:tRNA pseudouridine(55) synthase TruB [Staphylococcus succinus]|jgi:tRNA pseudouridine55 synthase|uniref:tRNA pseudouridine synthase B n=1 Tax=Staphylococcus succinus TaxID=61015 RepID=A0A9Q6MV21_9STAP|nr:tRNA pseudouridine(55) synthase TruB [Staphylococcus succinus]MEB8209584.1 tRNA pseudouridine(55) synthase TruB [Staphylococcus succinus]PTI43574.1 tRNA pseudouridine(55) synthase TruB [Staphylococcus succinus]PTI75006.1 tRNA pseudouridine(55) synthase TruB [Staphylococcus succinus]PTJ17506.1 tRNA pseudouridine(55) synthase TruB [Staphylococcus succinus]RIN27112.1 tRNA pseudouridine(55) synthase TruB [Staphylococcus succinus]